MDGREGGYIKLFRQIESWPLWRAMSAAQRMVWVQLLLCANWKDDCLWYGTQRVEVKRGQLAHSEAELARRAGVGRKVVRQAIEKLLAEGAIRREKAPLEGQAPHLVTIVNYERYQGTDDSEGPPQGQGRAKVGPSEGQGRALREEREEGEEGKKIVETMGAAPVSQRQTTVERLRVAVSQRLGVVGPGGAGMPPCSSRRLGQVVKDANAAVERRGFEAVVDALHAAAEGMSEKPETFGAFAFALAGLAKADAEQQRPITVRVTAPASPPAKHTGGTHGF